MKGKELILKYLSEGVPVYMTCGSIYALVQGKEKRLSLRAMDELTFKGNTVIIEYQNDRFYYKLAHPKNNL